MVEIEAWLKYAGGRSWEWTDDELSSTEEMEIMRNYIKSYSYFKVMNTI